MLGPPNKMQWLCACNATHSDSFPGRLRLAELTFVAPSAGAPTAPALRGAGAAPAAGAAPGAAFSAPIVGAAALAAVVGRRGV